MMNQDDIAGFKGDPSLNDHEDYLKIDYEFECETDPELAAAHLCSEQSTAQWKRPGVDEDLRESFGAKFYDLKVVGESSEPHYRFEWTKSSKFYRCKLRVAHPIQNFGYGIPNLLSAIAGEGACYCPGITTLKIKDLHFPKKYLDHYQGPQFGISGLRSMLGVKDRPFFIGVIKPNIGLSPEDFAQTALESLQGGLDIAKDDEMLGDVPWSTMDERCRLLKETLDTVKSRTGLEKMFIANITDDDDTLISHYATAEKYGINGVMIDGFFTGLSSIKVIRKRAKMPVIAHFTGMALWERMRHFGIDGVALVKLQRIMGADIIIMPGFGARMQMSDENVLANVKACLEPMEGIKPALPVPGGSDWAQTLKPLYEKIGHVDFGLIAGRGVFGHPQGPSVGAQTLHRAWEAIQKNIDLSDLAKQDDSIRLAIETFGG